MGRKGGKKCPKREKGGKRGSQGYRGERKGDLIEIGKIGVIRGGKMAKRVSSSANRTAGLKLNILYNVGYSERIAIGYA